MIDGKRETRSLVLRPFETNDAPRLVEIFSDPAVASFVGDGNPLSHDDAALWITRSAANLQTFGYGTGAVDLKESGEMIGWAGFARPQDGPEQLIYGMAQAHWGKGLGREIVSALVCFADERGMERLWATVDPENTRSIHLLRTHGFELIERNHGGDEHSDLYARSIFRLDASDRRPS